MTRIMIAGLDIETTGLDQTDNHKIIEIALSVYDLNTAVKVGQFATRVNPQRGIDPKAQEVHGIAFEELAHEPVWEVVAPKVHAILARCKYMVAHNGVGFDAPFVAGELLRVGLPMPELGVVDTMLQARWATADGALPNLGALCFACGVPYDPSKAHSAMYDTGVMMACFFSQLSRGFFTLPDHPWVYKTPAPRAKGKK